MNTPSVHTSNLRLRRSLEPLEMSPSKIAPSPMAERDGVACFGFDGLDISSLEGAEVERSNEGIYANDELSFDMNEYMTAREAEEREEYGPYYHFNNFDNPDDNLRHRNPEEEVRTSVVDSVAALKGTANEFIPTSILYINDSSVIYSDGERVMKHKKPLKENDEHEAAFEIAKHLPGVLQPIAYGSLWKLTRKMNMLNLNEEGAEEKVKLYFRMAKRLKSDLHLHGLVYMDWYLGNVGFDKNGAFIIDTDFFRKNRVKEVHSNHRGIVFRGAENTDNMVFKKEFTAIDKALQTENPMAEYKRLVSGSMPTLMTERQLSIRFGN